MFKNNKKKDVTIKIKYLGRDITEIAKEESELFPDEEFNKVPMFLVFVSNILQTYHLRKESKN
jgi:hypothetical protein